MVFLYDYLDYRPKPFPGIEVGNPNLEGKTLRIVPVEEGEIYQVTVSDETTAVVERFRENVFVERTAVPYTQSDETLGLRAVFADSRSIDVLVTLEENGTAVSGVLRLDDAVVEACFDLPDFSPVCEAGGDSPPPPEETAVSISEEKEESPTPEIPFYPQVILITLPDSPSSENPPAQDDLCVTCVPQTLDSSKAFERFSEKYVTFP